MPYDIPLLKEAITTFRINYGNGGGGRVEGGSGGTFWLANILLKSGVTSVDIPKTI